MSRNLTAIVAGKKHEIPEVWVVGFCQGARLRGEPCSVVDAVDHWLWQVELEAVAEAETSA